MFFWTYIVWAGFDSSENKTIWNPNWDIVGQSEKSAKFRQIRCKSALLFLKHHKNIDNTYIPR